MKPARIIVLAIAVVAGGAAALLAGRSESPPPAPPPVAQLETTDVLVAANNLSPGTKLAAAVLRWQTDPRIEADPGQRIRLPGGDPAGRQTRGGGRGQPRKWRWRIHPAQRPRGRHAGAQGSLDRQGRQDYRGPDHRDPAVERAGAGD